MEIPGDKNVGYGLAFAGAFFLSFSAIFIRYLDLVYQIPPLVLAFWRLFFVACFLGIYLGLKRRPVFSDFLANRVFFLAYGTILAVFNGTLFFSITLNGAAVATILLYTSAAFTTILGRIFLREEITIHKFLAVVISFLGCVLISDLVRQSGAEVNAAGMLVGVTAGLCKSSYSLMGRAASLRGVNAWKILFYIFSFAAIFLLVINVVLGPFMIGSITQVSDIFWMKDSVRGWLLLLLLAAGPTLLGYGSQNASFNYLPASVVNIILSIEPVFTTIIAFIILGEVLSVQQMAGGLLILSGVLLMRLKRAE